MTIVALSKDTPDEATLHKTRDGLNFTLLSDPEIKVIRAYGVEHHKALGQTKVPKMTIGGIPLGHAPLKFAAMAIPTTLLVDEASVIRWIDQTDDYRLRSSTDRVEEAVNRLSSRTCPRLHPDDSANVDVAVMQNATSKKFNRPRPIVNIRIVVIFLVAGWRNRRCRTTLSCLLTP